MVATKWLFHTLRSLECDRQVWILVETPGRKIRAEKIRGTVAVWGTEMCLDAAAPKALRGLKCTQHCVLQNIWKYWKGLRPFVWCFCKSRSRLASSREKPLVSAMHIWKCIWYLCRTGGCFSLKKEGKILEELKGYSSNQGQSWCEMELGQFGGFVWVVVPPLPIPDFTHPTSLLRGSGLQNHAEGWPRAALPLALDTPVVPCRYSGWPGGGSSFQGQEERAAPGADPCPDRGELPLFPLRGCKNSGAVLCQLWVWNVAWLPLV